MIKAVIFDLGGVLLDLDMQGCFHNIRALGVDLDSLSKTSQQDDSEQGATICEGMSASGMMHLYQVGKVTTEDFLSMMQKVCKDGTTYQEVLDAWNSCLLTIPEYKLDFIKELRSKGYATYLLSNTNDAHWQHIVQNNFPEPVTDYFDYCFLSQEMGMAKPNADIYESVLKQVNLTANECLFLDDSHANCEAAERLGINSIVIPVRSDFRDMVRRYLVNEK